MNSPINHEEDNIAIKNGQQFTITLESNRTSGYSWVPTFDTDIINLISRDFQSPSLKLTGASGKEIFTFKAINSGATTLKMLYKRSWKQHFEAEKTFFIDIT
jgi:predicted secreted protein